MPQDAPDPPAKAPPVAVSEADRAEAQRRLRKRDRTIQDALDDYRRFLDGLADKYDVLFVPWRYDSDAGTFGAYAGIPQRPTSGAAPPAPPPPKGD